MTSKSTARAHKKFARAQLTARQMIKKRTHVQLTCFSTLTADMRGIRKAAIQSSLNFIPIYIQIIHTSVELCPQLPHDPPPPRCAARSLFWAPCTRPGTPSRFVTLRHAPSRFLAESVPPEHTFEVSPSCPSPQPVLPASPPARHPSPPPTPSQPSTPPLPPNCIFAARGRRRAATSPKSASCWSFTISSCCDRQLQYRLESACLSLCTKKGSNWL